MRAHWSLSIHLVGVILFVQLSSAFAQTPSIEWQKCLGGVNFEQGYSIQQTADEGYIMAGYVEYDGGDVSGTIGGGDCWIVKLDNSSNIEWAKCLGGTKDEAYYGIWIKQTTDEGYVVATQTTSNDIDVSGNHGSYDGWIVKLDSVGNIEWQKCLGGSSSDPAYSIDQTLDQGYIVLCQSSSDNGDVTENHGGGDYWVVKLNVDGEIEWQKCLGGSATEEPSSIHQTNDKGYVVAGSSGSDDGDVTGRHGSFDYWIVKLDSIGNIEWQKCLGGISYEFAKSIRQTRDSGYIVVGYTASVDGDVSGNHGFDDYWVVKLNYQGEIQWQSCLGGSDIDQAYDVQQTGDSGYAVIGYTRSTNGNVVGNHSDASDEWLVKLSQSGELEWQKCLGGSNEEYGLSIWCTKDSGLMTGGSTASNDGDVNGNHGNWDCWVVKLSNSTSIENIDSNNDDLTVYPNPFSNSTTISFNLRESNHTTIQLLDVTGRRMEMIFDENAAQGNHNLQFDRKKFASGIYFLRIIINGEAITKKLLIL